MRRLETKANEIAIVQVYSNLMNEHTIKGFNPLQTRNATILENIPLKNFGAQRKYVLFYQAMMFY